MKGMFYAVGVGPGDPMWMTREACGVLEACPVIAAPQTASGEMLALSIAQGAAELGGKTVLPLSFAMSRDAAVRAEGITYNRFIQGLHLAGIELDRRALAELAVSDPEAFKAIVEQAKAALPADVNAPKEA